MNDDTEFDYVTEEEYTASRQDELKRFHDLLESRTKSAFVADYVQSEGLEQLRPGALGLIVANDLRWNGEDIARFLLVALASGLEDANWHTECAIVVGMIERMDAGETIAQVLKPLAGDST